MSRGNVFKLSGNMALGASDPYPNTDISDIKNSLKLLKAKQNQKKSQQYGEAQYGGGYGGSGSYSSNLPQRNEQVIRNNQMNKPKEYDNYNYDMLAKNHIPKNEAYREPSGSQYENYGHSKNTYERPQPPKPKAQQKPEWRNNDEYEQPRPIVQRNKGKTSTYKEEPERSYNNQGSNRNNVEQISRNPPPRNPPQRNQPQYQQEYRQPEKSIKQINKQNRVDIVEYDPSQLIECGEGCGRKFNPDSIDKHEAICKKVFQKKRKQFNTQEQRIVSNDQKKLMKRGEIVEKKIEEKKAKEKIPKWKAESLAFRAGLKAAQGGNATLSKQEQRMLDQSKKDGTIQCQFCGRNFNEQAGNRHIPFCEEKSKKNKMKR